VLDASVPGDAAGFMGQLGEQGIGTRPFFWPLHQQPVFKGKGLFRDEHYPVAERLARRGFYLPSGLALTDGQMDQVVTAVRSMLA
jgi:perosamine synthetase